MWPAWRRGGSAPTRWPPTPRNTLRRREEWPRQVRDGVSRSASVCSPRSVAPVVGAGSAATVSPMALPLPTIADIRASLSAIGNLIVRTPLIEVADGASMFGRRVLLKAETMQRTGSFKYRGACAFLHRLGPEGRANGVVAFSSGNHAQAVAAAAAHFGVAATIVMPSDAPEVKVQRTRARG